MEQNTQLERVKLGIVANTCTCFNLRKASRAITQLFDEKLQPSGLLITQFTILVAVSVAGSGTMNDLADGLGMDRTTLTRNLKPLEKQGLITIVPGSDQRVRLVSLTDRGRAALVKALPLWESAQACVIEGLGESRWKVLLAGLSDTTSIDFL